MAYGVDMLRIKAFIYRLSSIFGKRIYLAKKEEDAHFAQAMFASTVLSIITGRNRHFIISLNRGMWHAEHGFTSVYTRHITRFKAIKQNIIHLFKG